MDVSRKTFLGGAFAAAATGFGAKTPLPRYVAPGEIKAVLLHLGHNMWCDWFPEGFDLETAVASIKANPSLLPDT